MAIQKFDDFDDVQAYGGFSPLPKGGYVVRIKAADICQNSVGQYVKIAADIEEGEHKGYFARDFENQKSYQKWHCYYFLSVPNNDGTERDTWSKRKFKTCINALETSNPGYKFDWDESKFKGLLVGGLFNYREYVKSDGSIGRSINFAQMVDAERIRSGNYTLPEDKVIQKPEIPYDDFTNISFDDDDKKGLPF